MVHFEAEMSVLQLPSSRPVRARSCGDAVNPGGFSLDLQPEGGASRVISAHRAFGGSEQGPGSVSAETKGMGTSISVPSLKKQTNKKKELLGLALFQSRFRLASFN